MKNRKNIKVALLFGGKSAEHEVSLMSAQSLYEALDKNKYEIQLIAINKTGRWLSIPDSFLLNQSINLSEILQNTGKASTISINPALGGMTFSSRKKEEFQSFDVVFPVLHGPCGEDGSVQGLLKLAGIPYVGAGVLGSAIGMDKDVMKRLLDQGGLPIAKFIVLYDYEKPISFMRLRKKLGLPFFIKPANLGSSVGVACVENKMQYDIALAQAFRYDNKIIIEEFVSGREVECAVLGNEDPIASLPGEVVPTKSRHSFYSYQAKYLDKQGAKLVIPAKLSKIQTETIQRLAISVFKLLCCHGMARVDFFLSKNGSILVNEINTIPGFTPTSMYPKLWQASGVSYKKLVDSLIELAIKRFEKEQKLAIE